LNLVTKEKILLSTNRRKVRIFLHLRKGISSFAARKSHIVATIQQMPRSSDDGKATRIIRLILKG
jgi:hypothetical protein